ASLFASALPGAPAKRARAPKPRRAAPETRPMRVAARQPKPVSPPRATASLYERTTAPSVLREQGCRAGRQRTSGLVVLDFGKPAFRRHVYGTVTFSGRFASNTSITWATKAYARGYHECLPKRSGARIVLVRFRSAARGVLLYNYGSLDGGAGAIWNVRQAYFVAAGMRFARTVPEIYNRAMAEEWAYLSRVSVERYGKPLEFAGVMTQHRKRCRRCGFTAAEAHRA